MECVFGRHCGFCHSAKIIRKRGFLVFMDSYLDIPAPTKERADMNNENGRAERIRMFDKLTTFNLAPLLCVAIPCNGQLPCPGAIYLPDRLRLADVIPLLETALERLKQGSVTPAENAIGATQLRES